jgi:hypothetical protein
MAMSPQDMSEHCERLRSRLEEKRSELAGMDPKYALYINAQITAMEHRVDEITLSLPALTVPTD